MRRDVRYNLKIIRSSIGFFLFDDFLYVWLFCAFLVTDVGRGRLVLLSSLAKPELTPVVKFKVQRWKGYVLG